MADDREPGWGAAAAGDVGDGDTGETRDGAAGNRTGGTRPGRSRPSLWQRMYHGDMQLDIVGNRRIWFALSAVLMLVSVGSLLTRGLNLGIEFEGGAVWEVEAGDASVADARGTMGAVGLDGATIQRVEPPDGPERLRIETKEVGGDTDRQVVAALEELTGNEVGDAQVIGPSWGDEITEQARDALIWFLVLVSVYIAIRFHVKSALPAMVALLHDVVVTVGVYSVGQFQITPATVIAFLTILGYSLYDTVVVFDKVEENTRLVTANGTLTYGAMVNLSLNQTLMRSVNTTVTALLPVGSLLVVGAWLMGAATLRDFALALLVGLLAGAYSSFFIASPLLAMLKEPERTYRKIRERVTARGLDPTAVPSDAGTHGGRGAAPAPAAVGASASGGDRDAGPSEPSGRTPAESGSSGRETTTLPSGRVIAARPRKKRSRR